MPCLCFSEQLQAGYGTPAKEQTAMDVSKQSVFALAVSFIPYTICYNMAIFIWKRSEICPCRKQLVDA
jgi:hypothetical protein